MRGDGVRFEWGAAGAVQLAATCAALVVVDVLSFSTAVAVAVGRDIRVHPCPWPGGAVDAEATWLLSEGYCTAARPVGVVAAGERWPDGSLRPAVEDLLGAALVLDGLAAVPGGLSVDAEVARRALPPAGAGRAAAMATGVRACASGRELIDGGFEADVELAAGPLEGHRAGSRTVGPDGVGVDGVDLASVVPVLCGGAFVSAA